MRKIPTDLITIADAAQLSDRGKSTVRLWVRKGLVSGHKKNAANKNSPLLVSRSEIMAHLAMNGKINPPRPKQVEKISVSATQWRNEKDVLLEKINRLENEKILMNQLLGQAQENAKIHQMMAAQLISARELAESELQRQIKAMSVVEENNIRLSRRIEDLMVYLAMPWWRKWSTGAPLLTTSNDPMENR